MMKMRRTRTINRNQRGFTLVELLIAIAISVVIGSAVGGAAYQVFNINAASTNHQIVINQVQNAVNSLSRDAEQAQYIVPKNSSDIPLPLGTEFKLVENADQLTLNWTDWDNTRTEIIYTVVNGILQRTLKVNGGQTSQTNVANNISVASGSWNLSTKVLDVTIESRITAPKPAAETRTFQIMPRSAK